MECSAVQLGAEIRRLRSARGMSQRALTRLIGLSAHSNLADYETGRRLPPADIVAGCELALGVTDGSLRRLHEQALAERASLRTADLESAAGPALVADILESVPIRDTLGDNCDDGGFSRSGWFTRWFVRGSRRFNPSLVTWLAVLGASAVVITALLDLGAVRGGSGGQPDPPWTPPLLGHHISAVAISPNRTLLTDGLDPRQAACDRSVTTLDSAELRLPATARINGILLPAGTIVGHVTLRYSVACHTAWARVDPMPAVDAPTAGTVDVYAIRPADGTRTEFHLGHLEEAYGDMLLTRLGCVQAEGAINLTAGPVVSGVTRCLAGPGEGSRGAA